MGEEAKNLTDEEIEEIRQEQDRWADFIFDVWIEEHNKKNK